MYLYVQNIGPTLFFIIFTLQFSSVGFMFLKRYFYVKKGLEK